MTDGPTIRDIAEPDYQLWRHHPVSKVVLQYLADYSAALEREIMARWRGGMLQLVDEKEARGRLLACQDIVELNHESIRSFYEGEKPVDATKTA